MHIAHTYTYTHMYIQLNSTFTICGINNMLNSPRVSRVKMLIRQIFALSTN